jgi:hypothetical protein
MLLPWRKSAYSAAGDMSTVRYFQSVISTSTATAQFTPANYSSLA